VGTVKVPEVLPAAEDCADSVPTNNGSITYRSNTAAIVSMRPKMYGDSEREKKMLTYLHQDR